VPLIADDEYEPDDIVIAVSTSAFHTQNNNNDLVAGTGVIVGNGIWRLPESNNPILPFIGFGAEELTAADWSSNLTITLASIISPSGNGHFSVYQSDGLGGWNFFMSTAVGGITSADKVEIAAEGHDHFNMTFSEAGNWIVNLFASGTHATDGLQTSNTYSFSFAVAPEPSRALLSLIGFSMLCLRRRRA